MTSPGEAAISNRVSGLNQLFVKFLTNRVGCSVKVGGDEKVGGVPEAPVMLGDPGSIGSMICCEEGTPAPKGDVRERAKVNVGETVTFGEGKGGGEEGHVPTPEVPEGGVGTEI